MLEEDSTKVAVWTAEMTVDEATVYLKETYEDDDGPISAFAADLSVSFYDHDWLEWAAANEGASLRELLGRISSGDSIARQMSEEQLVQRCRTVLVLFRHAFDGPPRGNVRFVGTFECPAGMRPR